MPLKRANEQTPCGALFDILKRFGGISHKELASPCGALFDILKRFGGISHKELASMFLSERPLADGRSPQSRSSDRSWVSRFVVHAPADASQERLFRDYGVAAQRVMNRLRTSRSGSRTCAEIGGEP